MAGTKFKLSGRRPKRRKGAGWARDMRGRGWRRRRTGIVTVLVALCLTVVVGIAALAIDGGVLLEQRRRVQAAADAAALAAATDLFYFYPYDHGFDTYGTAKQSALAVAAANGFDSNDALTSVTVNIPPLSGDYVDQPGYAEIIIEYDQPRGFSSIFGGSDIPVSARAVAQGKWTDISYGIIVLDPESRASFRMTGNGTTTVTGAGVIVDSNDPAATTVVGNGTGSAPFFDVVGGTSYSGNGYLDGEVNVGVMPVPDPLRYLPEPDPSTLPIANGGHRLFIKKVTGNGLTIYPGVYKGGIKSTANSSKPIYMQPGIYYMDGGGFQIVGRAPLIGEEVMIFNAPKSCNDRIELSGKGSVYLTPMKEGPYRGITIFQQRDSDVRVKLTGQGDLNVTGTFYAARALFDITGQGDSDNIGSQYISYQLDLNGNGSINVGWNPDDTARVRVVRLVE